MLLPTLICEKFQVLRLKKVVKQSYMTSEYTEFSPLRPEVLINKLILTCDIISEGGLISEIFISQSWAKNNEMPCSTYLKPHSSIAGN